MVILENLQCIRIDDINTHNENLAVMNLVVDIKIPPPLSDIPEITEDISSTLMPEKLISNSSEDPRHQNIGISWVALRVH